MKIEKLIWDSDFFNLQIGKVFSSAVSLDCHSDLDNFDLIYFFVSPNNISLNQQLIESNAILVDEKVTYHKKVNETFCLDNRIYPYYRQFNNNDNEVVRIGLQSGIYSRFKVDPEIKNEDFERLYTIWINKSIDRKMAKEVFVFEDNNQIAGVVTIRELQGRGDIGIIAVDEKARGKEVGKKMLSKANAYCYELGLKELQVVTQKANIQACNFYEKCGFTIESITNIYHLWKRQK